MFKSVARSKRARRLLGTTRFVVLSNFLRSGIVEFLGSRTDHAADLDEVVDFYLGTASPVPSEDIDLLLQYYKGAANPTKAEFVHFLIERASWLKGRRKEVKFNPPAEHDWNPFVRALRANYDPGFAGNDRAKRAAARTHWNNFLTMADAFGIARYENERVQLSENKLIGLRRELELFGDGYYGVDDLLGVTLKVEALRGDTSWVVRPPPFMLEACDAVARRVGIAAYWKFASRLNAGGCRVLDLGCGSGIYSNAFAGKGNECVAVDHTPWVFFRAFLGARPGVRVECCDMNSLPPSALNTRFTHIVSNIAAHHFCDRAPLFRQFGDLLEPGGEICVLNFDYSRCAVSWWDPIAVLKSQFAAQIRYNWTVLEFDRGGVQFISPHDVADDLRQTGFVATVHACGGLGELFFVRGIKQSNGRS